MIHNIMIFSIIILSKMAIIIINALSILTMDIWALSIRTL